MSDQYPHLILERLEPFTPRRQRRGWGGVKPPDDPVAHGVRLVQQLEALKKQARQREAGFDSRLLIKLEADGLTSKDLQTIPGITVVSEESRTFTVLFADESGRQEFEKRLNELAQGASPTRKEILWAIRNIDDWTPDERMGPALRLEGLPDVDEFVVDVELWPSMIPSERAAILSHFSNWVTGLGATVIDRVNQLNLVMARVKVNRKQLERMLAFRDVRQIDLPPRYDTSVNAVEQTASKLPSVVSPPNDAPTVAVLDTGLATNHPLLAPVVGDAQSFVDGRVAADEEGHGTQVVGHVVFGNVEAILDVHEVQTDFWILSGRIIVKSESEFDDTPFMENRIREAVEYFVRRYGCRIFNLSIGDIRKPYVGGHVRGLAAVIDELAYEHGVLFIVSAGNFRGVENTPKNWLRDYPDYLFNEAARIIDPAPALNALTVGSIARRERPRQSVRFPNDPAYQPIARVNCPSPFSRTGPGPGDAIKPEIVEYGGNWSYNARTNSRIAYDIELGEFTTNHEVVSRPFASISGTSFAAPKVAHLAGRLLARYPNLSAEALRALIIAHAAVPDEALKSLDLTEEKARHLMGFGKPVWERVLSSEERCVALFAEASISESTHHFYEIPLPGDFLGPPARRPREITVALAYTSPVRRTRISYRANRLSFRVVREESLERVASVFRTQPARSREPIIQEAGEFRPSFNVRSRGNNQAATWRIGQIDKRWDDKRLFVVVTHQPEPWAEGLVGDQRYALVVVLRDLSQEPVRLYTQLRARIRVRPRVRW